MQRSKEAEYAVYMNEDIGNAGYADDSKNSNYRDCGYAVHDYSFCSKSYLSLRLMPFVLMSRFFVIRRLASSAELANSR